MECLQTYGSSVSESDSDSCHDSNSTKKSSMLKEDSSQEKVDFFGLDMWTQPPPPSSAGLKRFTDEEKLNRQNHKDITDNSSCNVPDGDFWKGFVPEITDEDDHNFHHDLKQTNTHVKKNLLENKEENNIKKRPLDSEHAYKSKSMRNDKHICSLRLDNKCEESYNSNQHFTPNVVQQQEKRKMFYVHSKVTPYLTSSCCCKCSSKPHSSWRGHEKAVNRLSWNRSNYSHLLLTAGMDTSVKVWNVWSSLDGCVSTIPHHSKAVRTAVWGRAGTTILSCSYDRTAVVTDVETGSLQSRHPHPGYVISCTLHPHNPHIFATGTDNLIQFWDVRTPLAPTKALTFKDEIGQPQDLLFIQGGNEIISCSDVVSRDSADRTIMAWDVRSGNVISNQIYQERYTCTRLKPGPSNSHFLAQTQGGYVAMFSATRPYKIDKNKRFEGHQMQGYNIGFDVSHDGSLVYSGSADGGIHCYDYRSARLLRKCQDGPNTVITDVACHPVLPTLVAACTWGGGVALWQ